MVRQPAQVAAPRRPTVLHRALPEPPEKLRQGPLREQAWRSPLRSERTAALLGLGVAITFGICFVTGVLSHVAQNPPSWLTWPARPVGLYRVTQGLHVVTGFAAIPLLLAKLWTVYPKLFEWPPLRSLAHAAGRLGLLILVGAGLFQLVTGVLNVARWYTPMPFFFTVAHYWTAWIIIGAILIHVGSKLAVIRRGLARGQQQPAVDPAHGGLTRRGFLTTVAATSGVLALTTAGQTVPGLSRIAVLAQRDPGVGSQGLPVNKSAVSAGVEDSAMDPTYRLFLEGPRPSELSLAQLRSMSGTTVSLPITCVEGWSASATWTGIRVSDLLDLMGLPADASVMVESLQEGGLYRTSVLAPPHSRDPLTLLALQVNGEDLNLDHGYPLRLIAPNRPGVLQTKWVSRVRAL